MKLLTIFIIYLTVFTLIKTSDIYENSCSSRSRSSSPSRSRSNSFSSRSSSSLSRSSNSPSRSRSNSFSSRSSSSLSRSSNSPSRSRSNSFSSRSSSSLSRSRSNSFSDSNCPVELTLNFILKYYDGISLDIPEANVDIHLKCDSKSILNLEKEMLDNEGSITIKLDIHSECDIQIRAYIYMNGRMVTVSKLDEAKSIGYLIEDSIKFDGKKKKLDNTLEFEVGKEEELEITLDLDVKKAIEEYNYIIAYTMLANAAVIVKEIFDELTPVTAVIGDKRDNQGYLINGYENNIITLSITKSWQPMVWLHEYGHHVMATIYSINGIKDISLGDLHYKCLDTGLYVSWGEGYADFFSVLISKELDIARIDKGIAVSIHIPGNLGKSEDDGENIYSIMTWKDNKDVELYNIEYYACNILSIYKDEGRVTAMLYDLYDERDDSISNKEVETMINVYKGTPAAKREWFGKDKYSDENKGYNEIITGIKTLLIDALKASKSGTVMGYMLGFESLEISEKEKEYACKIFIYNYGGISSSECNSIEARKLTYDYNPEKPKNT